MKTIVLIIILIFSNSVFACNNSLPYDSDSVQFAESNLLQTDSEDCCNELCLCNCCKHISVVNFIVVQNIYDNFTAAVNIYSIQNLSDYFSLHWQPPQA